jgi:hypothetical protein
MRLLAFADRLKKAKERKPFIEDIFLEWPYRAKIYYCIKHNTSIFYVLSELSNAWYFNEKTRNWELKDFPDMGTFRACLEWFGLTQTNTLTFSTQAAGKTLTASEGKSFMKTASQPIMPIT